MTYPRLAVFSLLAAFAVTSAALRRGQPRQNARDLTGEWQLWRRPENGPNAGTNGVLRFTVVRRGDSLIGSSTNGPKVAVRASSADTMTWRGTTSDGKTPLELALRWSGDSLIGTNVANGVRSVAWLVRDPVRPAGAPTRHVYRPTVFHRVFSASVSVPLRIFPGDTVSTETLDAGGRDSMRAVRSPGGNPLTGPFWIQGALPGDVIAVHLLRVRTNRTTASSGSELSWNAVEPDYITDYKEAADTGSSWTIDAAAGVARLTSRNGALRDYTIPLKPMLGCIGVAPPSFNRPETRSSGFPGYWGGNMDYNRVAEGATIYLQVSQPGAFLFIGDGHAAQGDAELTGSGLETSMNVQFSVELLRSKQIGFPKLEDASDLMSVGIGGSIDRAFQTATTGLARWLEMEYKLTRSDAAIVMGTAARYDIGEVVDGDFNVVARLPKAALRRLTRDR
jgi:acetamidase/formamidase